MTERDEALSLQQDKIRELEQRLAMLLETGETLKQQAGLEEEPVATNDELKQELIAVRDELASSQQLSLQLSALLLQTQTERDEINKSLEELRFVLEQSAMVSIMDVHGKLTYVNDERCLVSQYTCEELLLQSDPILDLEYLSKEHFKELWKTITVGKVWKGIVKSKAKDGHYYWVDATIVPFLDEQNKPYQYMAIYFDITKRKLAERALHVATMKAEEANRTKSVFLANISHELRTPMHAILSFAAFGVDKINTASTDKLLHYFKRIYQSGGRLLSLLNDLLDLSRLQSGKMPFNKMRSDLVAVVENVVAELQGLSSEKNLNVVLEKPEFSTWATFDPDRITQVIMNLMSNAIKFSPLDKKITLSLGRGELNVNFSGMEKPKPALIFRIRDQGEGIPEDELDKIFDVFIQSSKINSGTSGTGLGLAICREIVTGHEGRLWAENVDGGGAAFIMMLPLH